MDLFSRYAINTPDVVAEDFNGEIVILNLANGHYFSLCGIACAIWSLLLAGHTPHSIVASIEAARRTWWRGRRSSSSAYSSCNSYWRAATWKLLPSRSRNYGRAMVPAIEVYEDLAELIFADPIHDVDERAGWPTPRQT